MSVIQTVLITGARRGLGYKLCAKFSEAGYQVCGSSREADQLGKVFTQTVLNARAFSLDFSKKAVEFKSELESLPKTCDVIVHNASPYDDSKLATFDEQQLNLCTSFMRSNFIFFQFALNNLTPNGKLIVIGSIAGRKGMMNKDRTMYSIYKASLISLVEAFNLEALHGRRAILIVLGNMRETATHQEAVSEDQVAKEVIDLTTKDIEEEEVLLIGENDPHKGSLE